MVPKKVARRVKGQWLSSGGYAAKNPIKKIGLAIQQIGDQLIIVALIHHCVAQISVPSVIKGAGITVLLTGNFDNDTIATLPMAEAATAPVAAAGPLMATHYDYYMLFSQQFMIQQQVEDLRQELINKFTNQKQ